MNQLVIMKNQQAVTDSLTVSKIFGKRHLHVLRDIDNLAEKNGGIQNWIDPQGNKIFAEGVYEHPQNHQKYRIIYMNRRGFVLLAMGFTGKRAFEFKNKYIDAFDAMEIQLREQPKLPQTPMETLELMFKAQKQTDEKVNKVDERMDRFEANEMLSPGEYNYIAKKVSGAVAGYIEVHGLRLNIKQRSKLFKDINRQINEVAGVKTRTQLRKKHFEKVDRFIAGWNPSSSTIELIKELGGKSKGQQELIK
jgi:Rha family phage regulatory protein